VERGVVYSETVVFSPPERFAADAPYQLAIVDLADGRRLTARILGNHADERVRIGDSLVLAEQRDGVRYFRKA
jgi:uncharacterized OB-fold protein